MAEQGDANAQNNLGHMYEQGRGLLKNLREAYRWFYIAHSNGNHGATEKLKEITTRGWVSDAPVFAEDAEKIRREADDWMRQKGWK